MYLTPPPTTTHWVYDDPSGISDTPERRQPLRAVRVPVRRFRFVHREA